MKAYPKKDLVVGAEVEENGHQDNIVHIMLDSGLMNLEPYTDSEGNVVPNWYSESKDWGFNWHISWLEVVEK